MLLVNILVSLLPWAGGVPYALAAPGNLLQEAAQQQTAPNTQQTPPQAESNPAQPAAQVPATEKVKPSASGGSVTPTPAGVKKPVARKTRRRKRVPPADGVQKTVVRNGGASEPKVQLSPGVPQQKATQERQDTSQLLAITDGNLQKASSVQLNDSQQETVRQIRNYTEQAKLAAKQGDLQRAQNLASKARQLSDDLVKPRK